jgi:hypothetical protein
MQGDVAVGRINREDVADVLTQMLFEPHASGKTLETIAIPGYPKPLSLDLQLSRLQADTTMAAVDARTQEAVLDAQYALLQQLVPGETMQPNQLAMGQTYEQLDRGEQAFPNPQPLSPKPNDKPVHELGGHTRAIHVCVWSCSWCIHRRSRSSVCLETTRKPLNRIHTAGGEHDIIARAFAKP